MPILCFGGSFSPISLDHLLVARYAKEQEHFSEVIFVPCGDAPHRNDLISFDDRLEMVKIAIYGEPGFDYSACEGIWAKEGKKSFSINTFRYLQQHIGEAWWLIGSDTLFELPKWHNFEAVRREMKFIVTMRKPNDLETCKSIASQMELTYRLLEENFTVASATDVRNRLKTSKSIKYFVTEGVEKYIKEKCLYKT